MKKDFYTTKELAKMFDLQYITVVRRLSSQNAEEKWGAKKVDLLDNRYVYVVPEEKLYLWEGENDFYLKEKKKGRKPIFRRRKK